MTGARPKNAVFPRAMRLAGAIRDGWQCQLCGCPVQTGNPSAPNYLVAGHIVAWIDGGADTMENLRTECKRCSERGGSEIASERRAIERANAGQPPSAGPRSTSRESNRRSSFLTVTPPPE